MNTNNSTCNHGNMLFMIIEKFHDGKPALVYRRFRDKGRLAPAGLPYVNSCVAEDMTLCYQIMECENRALIDEWVAAWRDIVDFEVISVMTSAEAAATVGPRL
ncbi:MAG: DUF3303 family protein [Gemmatimonadaceae bacterium]